MHIDYILKDWGVHFFRDISMIMRVDAAMYGVLLLDLLLCFKS